MTFAVSNTGHTPILQKPHISLYKPAVLLFGQIYLIAVCKGYALIVILRDMRHVHDVRPVAAVEILPKLPLQLIHRRIDLYGLIRPGGVYLQLLCPALDIQDVRLVKGKVLCPDEKAFLFLLFLFL